MTGIVPESNDWLRARMFVTQGTQARCAQQELPPMTAIFMINLLV